MATSQVVVYVRVRKGIVPQVRWYLAGMAAWLGWQRLTLWLVRDTLEIAVL